jgi:hypothetical protein
MVVYVETFVTRAAGEAEFYEYAVDEVIPYFSRLFESINGVLE